MPEVVLDTCVLSNFALSRSLYILQSLYDRKVHITSFVMAEILRGLQKGYGELSEIKKALADGWLIKTSLRGAREKEYFEGLTVSLGAGESSCIAVAKSRGFIFASDDSVARREALLLDIPLTGTVGILVSAVKRKVISVQNAETILVHMKQHGFYSPIASMHDLIKS